MVEIPAAVLANWSAWWPGRARQLADDLQRRWSTAVVAWGLDAPRVMAGGEVGLVSEARWHSREVVLKLSPDVGDPALAAEGAALERWAQAGAAPQLLGARDGGLTLLLARIRPGRSLRDTGTGADEIIATTAALLPRLHLDVEPGRFASLQTAATADGWFRALATTREHDELARLIAPGPDDRLLHLDLHWLNVLRGPAGWLAIDPKPAVGDPHADVFAFFDGPPLHDLPAARAAAREQLWCRISDYARAAGLDADRTATWIRLRAAVVLAQSVGGGYVHTEALARLADALG